ncbi:vesicle-trafficking protein SEC22a-like [Mya arenaria]|uniref:vesicle-trafficking protein SEC22a-like n=1 Tax=Mya arenaria TaxID=6604 RepID=UPI0022E4AF5E|nr:vesicle-trafficking protein SEC22a-like [Mya arenaria]XP_052797144.1 vesicle-trafficking protein SEC22a-like [Mya arenaria]
MIHFAVVSRSTDGLTLVANSDSPLMSMHLGLEEAYRKLKMLSRLSAKFPDRWTLHSSTYAIHSITALDLSLLVLCDVTYPQVLAFSFLFDLQREFLVFYDKQRVMSVQRPYALIDFDILLQKLKQRYNNPRHLSTCVNLQDLSEELRLRPPYMIGEEELRPGFGQRKAGDNIKCTVAMPYTRYLPLHVLGVLSLSLCCFCALLNFSRGVHIINDTHAHMDTTFDIDHYQTGFTFIVSCFLSLYQAYLICYPHKRRAALACATLSSICVCQLYLYEQRSVLGLGFHIMVACYGTFVIVTRKMQSKLPQRVHMLVSIWVEGKKMVTCMDNRSHHGGTRE